MIFRFVFVLVIGVVSAVGDQLAAQTLIYDELKDELEDWDGAAQAKIHCVRCHIFPQPELLPMDAWSFVLDLMGLYLGYDDGGLLAEIDEETRRDLFDVDQYPASPLIGPFQWAAIRDYYEGSEGSGPIAPPPNGTALEGFEAKFVYSQDEYPVSSMVKISAEGNGFFLASEFNRLELFDQDGVLQSSELMPGATIQLDLEADLMRATVIGRMHPSNHSSGSILQKPYGDGDWQILLKGLHRPVHSLSADFDHDGTVDLFVNEFGHYIGSSSLYINQGSREFKRHTLRLEPGSISASVLPRPGNKALPDLLVLNAQARQELTLYRNLGEVQFEAEILLQKPPSFGYTQMHLADLNNDGIQELVTVNGDNADLPGPPLKAYHGVRVYSILEGPKLKEEGFLYLPGAFQASLDDFDGNGLTDIALVSYFPDSRRPEQGFVLFENKGNFAFERKVLDAGADAPWMTIDSGDVDGDGDADIVLGSAYIKRALTSTSDEPMPAAMILRNNRQQASIKD